MAWRTAPALLIALALLAVPGAPARTTQGAVRAGGDWTRFGYDAARHNAGPSRTGITARNVTKLARRRIGLPGTVDSSPIYLRGVRIGGGRHDAFFVTTSYGKTIAIDAGSGSILWTFTPSGYSSWAGSYRITNSSPVADPSRGYVYSAAPDGKIHKLAVANGGEVRSGPWPVSITQNPGREKIGPALNYYRGLVLAATGGYVGDAPPYQGHVAVIDARTGRLVAVWNGLCSNRRGLIRPSTCSESGAAIWARAGVVVVPGSGNLLVATGDGRFNGRTHWGDSVLMLKPRAGSLIRNWTPRNYQELDDNDIDLGSTAPALLGGGLAVQSGKDGKLRLLSLRRLSGKRGRTGGELQTVSTPGGQGLFSAPAVWRHRVYVGTDDGVWCYALVRGRLKVAWKRGNAGTSPVVAGGLVYAYNPNGGGVQVYSPGSGKVITRLRAGGGHWNSPIATDGRVAVGEGDANAHEERGVLDIYSVR
jgi:hypothetical protein